MGRLAEVRRREWLGLAAGLLAVAALFPPWTTLGSSLPETAAALAELPADEVTRSVWEAGPLAWFPPLLLALAGAAVVVLGQRPSVRRAGLPHLWLVAAAVALALLVLGWLTMEWRYDVDRRELLRELGVSVRAGAGRWLAVVAGVVSGIAAVLDVRAVRRTPPARRPGSV
ncbi:hypothetical protein SAMN05421810_10245 [Amycolatopsis arida]|uniref:Tryptophan-associated transmembrane protein (Trp_oprn_chp) n=1 Tax=Amycolatopsis arida TaxID=587909 RepID=A0A1I5NWN1_9PSEU|nr:hypothetical protein [Amycolatopsis arida]TDX98256.1 hypothetical protein CLV69_10145 [Amycolatopsis arida]SFP25736.1 hypothetical protein SAMN05421810_10245 [Amycolatopsis arida]